MVVSIHSLDETSNGGGGGSYYNLSKIDLLSVLSFFILVHKQHFLQEKIYCSSFHAPQTSKTTLQSLHSDELNHNQKHVEMEYGS